VKHQLPLAVALLFILAGCSARHPHQAPANAAPPPSGSGYVDLEPGWRVRVVTPILKSGKFIVDAKPAGQTGNEIVLKTGDDFIGYEIAFYSVAARPGGGVFVLFSFAETKKDGKSQKQSHPLVPLFTVSTNMRFVRLLFITRVSQADHNEAILAASSFVQLNVLTQTVRSNPEKNCTAYSETVCSWIPAGIAAYPEKRDPVNRNAWLPTW
jgi:hypothetical protein